MTAAEIRERLTVLPSPRTPAEPDWGTALAVPNAAVNFRYAVRWDGVGVWPDDLVRAVHRPVARKALGVAGDAEGWACHGPSFYESDPNRMSEHHSLARQGTVVSCRHGTGRVVTHAYSTYVPRYGEKRYASHVVDVEWRFSTWAVPHGADWEAMYVAGDATAVGLTHGRDYAAKPRTAGLMIATLWGYDHAVEWLSEFDFATAERLAGQLKCCGGSGELNLPEWSDAIEAAAHVAPRQKDHMRDWLDKQTRALADLIAQF